VLWFKVQSQLCWAKNKNHGYPWAVLHVSRPIIEPGTSRYESRMLITSTHSKVGRSHGLSQAFDTSPKLSHFDGAHSHGIPIFRLRLGPCTIWKWVALLIFRGYALLQSSNSKSNLTMGEAYTFETTATLLTSPKCKYPWVGSTESLWSSHTLHMEGWQFEIGYDHFVPSLPVHISRPVSHFIRC
jgi:hypothetical protein